MEEGQVGAESINEDMLPYSVFQRFCVLLLTIYGEVAKYQTSDSNEDDASQKHDTTAFLKSLNVYRAIVGIDQTIREKRFSPD